MNKRVLIACEESQTVCKEFRKLGFEAYSCDIQECSGGHPEWHLQCDIFEVINQDWVLMIAHPPCTELTIRGSYHTQRRGSYLSRVRAIEFFIKLAEAPIKHIAIENPVGIMSSAYRKPNQIIQPYEFGEPKQKKTCLWLKNLPNLKPTNIVEPEFYYTKTGNKKSFTDELANLPKSIRAKERSKTFHGIAKAMAEQWSPILNGSLEPMCVDKKNTE